MFNQLKIFALKKKYLLVYEYHFTKKCTSMGEGLRKLFLWVGVCRAAGAEIFLDSRSRLLSTLVSITPEENGFSKHYRFMVVDGNSEYVLRKRQ